MGNTYSEAETWEKSTFGKYRSSRLPISSLGDRPRDQGFFDRFRYKSRKFGANI
jgi:hypothetical protein